MGVFDARLNARVDIVNVVQIVDFNNVIKGRYTAAPLPCHGQRHQRQRHQTQV